MTQLTKEHIIYAFNGQTVGATTAASFEGASGTSESSYLGLDVGRNAIPLTDYPVLDPGQNIVDTRLTEGLPFRVAGEVGGEFQIGTRDPVTTWPWEASTFNLAVPLWTLFQVGASEAASSPYVKTYTVYTAQDFEGLSNYEEIWLSLGMILDSTSSDNFRIDGAICRSMTLSAAQGEAVKASSELIGTVFTNSWNHDSGSQRYMYTNQVPLMHQDFTFELGGTAFKCSDFSITVKNNATYGHYDSKNPQRFVLGMIEVEGNFKVLWDASTIGANQQLDDFLNGADKTFVFYNTSPVASAGDLKVTANVRTSDLSVTNDPETVSEVSFIGAYDGTNNVITIELADGIDRHIP